MPDVSVIIPTLNGERTLPPLLAAIAATRQRSDLELVAIDSGSRDRTLELLAAADARVLDLGGRPFGHASARNRAALAARGRVLVFLTQDVEPASATWLEPLVAALEDPSIAGAFGRQIPRDASPEESYMVRTNYPETPRAIGREALARPFGPGATLFSNAFGAMKRETWERFPFPDIIMSEDQAWGRDVLRAGLRILYTPDAAVYHGHRLGLVRAFRRNFDSGSSLEQLGLTGGVWSSGLRHLVNELTWIADRDGFGRALYAAVYEAVRMAGFQLGRMERVLPRATARRLGEAPRD